MNMVTLMDEIRKTPIFRQLVPQEAGIGWPIPLRKVMGAEHKKKVFVSLPFFGFARIPNSQETALYPPFALLTIDCLTQVPMEYVNLRFRNPWPEGQWEGQIGTFPHVAIAHLSVSQYLEQRNQLLSMYDELLDALVKDQALSSEWCALFSKLLRTLMEPSQEPYYRVLGQMTGSKFFETFLPSLDALPTKK
jgi:hypothetical protein